MSKGIISTKNSPAAIGPYSQGITFGNLVFTSGQLPIHPDTGEIPDGIEAQTIQVLENLKAIIEEAGCSMKDVLKATVYISKMSDFQAMNTIYATYFSEEPPARATVEAQMAKGALVEIDAIVIKSN